MLEGARFAWAGRRWHQAVRRLADDAVTFARPLVFLAVALPITAAALSESLSWVGRPFGGFLLMENALISPVSAWDWPPDRAAFANSQVLAVDGLEVRTSADVNRVIEARPLGSPVTYELRQNGRRFTRTLPTRAFTFTDFLQVYFFLILDGCLALALGVIVGVMQPRARPARVFVLQMFVSWAYPTTGVFLHSANHPALAALSSLGEVYFPAAFTHLAMVFPIDRPWTRKWAWAPYLVSSVLLLWEVLGFYHDPPDLSGLSATYIWVVVSSLIFLVSLLHTHFTRPDLRARTRVILPALLIGAGPVNGAFLNNALGGSFPFQFGAPLMPLFYAGVAYTIVRHGSFDIDRIVRQSFIYGCLSVLIVGTYALALTLPVRLFPVRADSYQTILGLVFVTLLVLALEPLRTRVQGAVDRAFYRTRLNYRATISELSEVLTASLDLHEIISQVTRVPTTVMHLESTSIGLLDGHGAATLWLRRSDGAVVQREGLSGVAALVDVLQRLPRAFQAAVIVEGIEDAGRRRAAQAFLHELAASIVLPLTRRGTTVGVLILGAKRSGLSFDTDDIELLRTLANQTAIATQNAQSYAALQALTRDLDATVQQQTADLRTSNARLTQACEDLKAAETQLVQSEKMASLGQLVAGVAHELNNPASFVHGSLSNLNDYVQRFVDVIQHYEQLTGTEPRLAGAADAIRTASRLDYLLRETPELLRICQEGSDRIKRVVDDLRVFARADHGDFARTDLVSSIDTTVRLLGNRVQHTGVRVTVDQGNIPCIIANAGRLNQVWMNLLTNAIDAVEQQAEPRIDIGIRPWHAPGADTMAGVEVAVRDNGVGIPAEQVPRIFEPFFTTKPIGRGTGLGMSIVYGTVKSHGGTLAVESAPGRGTVVTVRLPLAPPHPESATPGAAADLYTGTHGAFGDRESGDGGPTRPA